VLSFDWAVLIDSLGVVSEFAVIKVISLGAENLFVTVHINSLF